MRTAFLSVTFAVAALMFGAAAVVAIAIYSGNGAADPVEVHATATEVTHFRRGTVVVFRTDQGVEDTVSGGSADVGEHITIYRYGSGEYGWEPRPSSAPLWYACGAAALCLSMVLIGTDQVRRSVRASRVTPRGRRRDRRRGRRPAP